MLTHYFKMAVRSVLRHKLYSLINILGLAVALTCVIFVILFARYELSYDKWIPGTSDLYQVEVTLRFPGKAPLNEASSSYPLGPAMREQIPGVIGMTRLSPQSLTVIHGDRQFLQERVDFVDPGFFRLIRLPFIEGDPRSALSQPESVVLSESTARQYFGNADPMGQVITANVGDCPSHQNSCPGDTVALRVTGVIRDLPQNTQLSGDAFIPLTSLADHTPSSGRTSWLNVGPYTYIELAPAVKPEAVLAAMPAVLDQDITGIEQDVGIAQRGSQVYSIHLTPFTQVHLDTSGWQNGLTPPESWNTVYGVIIIGALILLVACFNFTNLATARAALRAREIGLRRTLGAAQRQLAVQFLSEAMFLALLSLVCAVATSEILLPVFNGFLHQPMALDYASDWRLDLTLIGVAIGTGVLSGIYPALALARLRPVAALQAKAGSSWTSVGLRDVLVLAQFAVSIGLGIAAMVVFRQVDYAQSINLGFRRDDIVVIQNRTLTGERQAALAEALRANPGVSEVGLSVFPPFDPDELVADVQVPGQPSRLTLDWVPVYPNYPRVYGIALVSGRLLSAARAEDSFTSGSGKGIVNILVNVAGARRLGFMPHDALGRTVVLNGSRARIVGVLADTKVHGARERVAPTVYSYYPALPMAFSVRLRPGRIPQTLAFIDSTWHAFVPTMAIRRSFLSASFERLYLGDERQGTVFGVFVVIAIFIACLGLYGLVVFTAERRTKEVAVRKISGARTLDIMKITLWRISVPIMLGNVIAWPVTYYYLKRWLQAFADHIWLNPAYFLAGGTIALLIAWTTVFLYTLRLSRASPVHALRWE